MRGYVTSLLLSRLELETGKQITELFDLIAGVSTGSLIAGGLSNGMSADEVSRLYKTLYPEIFGAGRSWFGWLFSSKYDISRLEEIARKEMPISMGMCPTKTMIYAVQMSGPTLRPKFWKSWHQDDADYPLWQLATASSAAPTFFDPYPIGPHYYIDGGIAENNPATCSLAEAIRLEVPLENITAITVGGVAVPGRKNARKLRGLIKIGPIAAGLMLDCGVRTVDYQCQNLLGNRYLSAMGNHAFAIDSAEFEKMEAEADIQWDKYGEHMLNMVTTCQ